MKQLLELATDFKTSRPVFSLSLDNDGRRISVNVGAPIHKYRPVPEDGNVLSELLCDHYNERFYVSEGQFVVNIQDIAHNTMSEIRQSMYKFLEKNLEMKNPRQSKVYRWFYTSLPRDTNLDDNLCNLYKYMRTFCNSEMISNNTTHKQNTIALMEAIMEKYND